MEHSENTRLLLDLCTLPALAVTNTFFKCREIHNAIGIRPRSKHGRLIDYAIAWRKDLPEVLTEIRRGVHCNTDRLLFVTRLTNRPHEPKRMQQEANAAQFNTVKLKQQKWSSEYKKSLANQNREGEKMLMSTGRH